MSLVPPPLLGMENLLGAGAVHRLTRCHVAVIGVGGVGSWTVEALARAGVGRLTLIDLDEVCASNINRQLAALHSTVGQPKVEVLARRAADINPQVQVSPRQVFFTDKTAESLLNPGYDLIIDAIDSIRAKVHLAVACRALHQPLLVCGAAGDRRDPTALRRADLAEATQDGLLRRLRKILRREHGWARTGALGVPVVYSIEEPPAERAACAAQGGCDGGLGSAPWVTGTMGLVAAGWAVERLLATPLAPEP